MSDTKHTRKPTYEEMATAIKGWAEFDTELRIHSGKHYKQMMALFRGQLHRIAQDLDQEKVGSTQEQPWVRHQKGG